MRKADIISAGVVVLFGLVLLFIVIPLQVPGHEAGDYGLRAQDFPIAAAAAGTLLAAGFLAYRAFLTRSAGTAAAPIPARSWGYLAFVAVLLALAFFALDWLGFALGAPFVIAAFMMVMGERRPVPLAAMAVVVPLLIWLFFWKLLRFPLP